MDVGQINTLETTARSLVAEINRSGYAVLPDYVPPAELAGMKAFVRGALDNSGGDYAGFTTIESVAGSGLDTLGRSPEFRALIEKVYEIGCNAKATPEEYYQVLRCFSGKSAAPHSLLFHYDSYVVTVLIPIEIPTKGRTGDLIMIPNLRGVRSSYYRNVFDKIVLDNKLTQSALKLLHRFNLLPITRLKLTPGNAYFFWGYRSVHTNEACDQGAMRATALYHYVNPHLGRSRRARV